MLQTLLGVAVGGLVGFLSSIGGSFLLQWWQRRKEIESLKSAFYGEIFALLALIERRQYRELIKNELEHLKRTGKVSSIQSKVSRNYFLAYEHNIQKIGLLPAPLPEKIVSFYTSVWACLEDLETMRDYKFKPEDSPIVERLLEDLLQLADDTIEVGNETKSLIRPQNMTV